MTDLDAFRAKLIGTWSIMSCTQHRPSNPSVVTEVYTASATAYLIYTADGHMMALLQEPDGSSTRCYGGPFEMHVEPSKGVVVTHHVKASVPASWIGTEQRRLPTFETVDGEEVLTITTDDVIEVTEGEEQMEVVVRWRRAGDASK